MDDCASVKNYGCKGKWPLDEGFTEGSPSAAFALPARNRSNSVQIKSRREKQIYLLNLF